MSVAQSRRADAEFLSGPTAPLARAEPAAEVGQPVTVWLPGDLPAAMPSPVHRLQAELARLTATEEAFAEQSYPGWLRLAFPLVTSGMLWGAILWGVGVIA